MSSEKAWCAVCISAHPKGIQFGSGQGSVHSTPVLANYVYMDLAQGHCHAGTGLGLLVPLKENLIAAAYKENSLFPIVWRKNTYGPIQKYWNSNMSHVHLFFLTPPQWI